MFSVRGTTSRCDSQYWPYSLCDGSAGLSCRAQWWGILLGWCQRAEVAMMQCFHTDMEEDWGLGHSKCSKFEDAVVLFCHLGYLYWVAKLGGVSWRIFAIFGLFSKELSFLSSRCCLHNNPSPCQQHQLSDSRCIQQETSAILGRKPRDVLEPASDEPPGANPLNGQNPAASDVRLTSRFVWIWRSFGCNNVNSECWGVQWQCWALIHWIESCRFSSPFFNSCPWARFRVKGFYVEHGMWNLLLLSLFHLMRSHGWEIGWCRWCCRRNTPLCRFNVRADVTTDISRRLDERCKSFFLLPLLMSLMIPTKRPVACLLRERIASRGRWYRYMACQHEGDWFLEICSPGRCDSCWYRFKMWTVALGITGFYKMLLYRRYGSIYAILSAVVVDIQTALWTIELTMQYLDQSASCMTAQMPDNKGSK